MKAVVLQGIWVLACREAGQSALAPPCPATSAAALSTQSFDVPGACNPHAALTVRLLAMQVVRHVQRFGDKATATPADTVVTGAAGSQGNARSQAMQGTQVGVKRGRTQDGSGASGSKDSAADAKGHTAQKRRGPPPLQRFLDQLQRSCANGGQGSLSGVLASTAAYLCWQCAPEVGASGLAALAKSVLQVAQDLTKHATQNAAADSDGAAAANVLSWCLFALEGVAQQTWGVPVEHRCALASSCTHVLVTLCHHVVGKSCHGSLTRSRQPGGH